MTDLGAYNIGAYNIGADGLEAVGAWHQPRKHTRASATSAGCSSGSR